MPRLRKSDADPDSLPIGEDADSLPSSRVAQYALRVIAAYAEMMQDALLLYKPLPGNAAAYHASRARIRLLAGSNRAGKTLTATAETLRIARNMDPHRKVVSTGRSLRMLCVGRDELHIGQVMFRKMYWPGAFNVVPDEVTGAYRAVRPYILDPTQIDPIDLKRKRQWRPSAPMLTEKEADIAWDTKKILVPRQVTIRSTGAEMSWHTSGGAARQGVDWDYWHFDEEIVNESWLAETLRGTVDREGTGTWSATPQSSTPQFAELHKRVLMGEEGLEEFKLVIDDNPYFSLKAKQNFYNDCAALGESELAVRYFGRYAILERKVYPTYSRTLDAHGVAWFPIPDHWMRILVIDPGSRFSAALFFAVPPESNELHCYQEINLANQDAKQMAIACKKICKGHVFEDFVMDKKGGEQTSMGRANTVAEHYAEAFRQEGLLSRRKPNGGFTFANPDKTARILSVKRMLNDKLIKNHIGTTNQLDRQIQSRYYEKDNPTKVEGRTIHDLCDDWEYGISYFDDGLFYREPAAPAPILSRTDESLYQRFQRDQQAEIDKLRRGRRSIRI